MIGAAGALTMLLNASPGLPSNPYSKPRDTLDMAVSTEVNPAWKNDRPNWNWLRVLPSPRKALYVALPRRPGDK